MLLRFARLRLSIFKKTINICFWRLIVPRWFLGFYIARFCLPDRGFAAGMRLSFRLRALRCGNVWSYVEGYKKSREDKR